MPQRPITARLTLIAIFSFIILYLGALQLYSSVLYDPDSYYHIAITSFIKTFGPHYDFHWTRLSIFNNYFSDNHFLFHILSLPFVLFTSNLVLAAKIAVLFYNILFFAAFIFVLKKYVPSMLAGFFSLLILTSSLFVYYLLLFRAIILVNIILILSITFLIKKDWRKIFLLSLLYPLTHNSFYLLIIIVLIGETIRQALDREFYSKNILAAIWGSLIGCVIHPNFPNNIISAYLNSFLVPIYALKEVDLTFGVEVFSSSARFIFVNNFIVFFALRFILWSALRKPVKASLATSIWGAIACLYVAMSFFSDRFWSTTSILVIVFLAAYLYDCRQQLGISCFEKDKKRLLITSFLIIAVFYPSNISTLNNTLKHYSRFNSYYEDIGRWMKDNIPANEVIFHSYWSDAAYFICLNPKDDYLNCCDPIYMYYPHRETYALYIKLRDGGVLNPHIALTTVFNARYGYIDKGLGLYFQVKNDTRHFKILYDNDKGAVFKVVPDAN